MNELWIPSKYNVSAPLSDGSWAILSLVSGEIDVVSEDVWKNHLQPGATTVVRTNDVPFHLLKKWESQFLVADSVDEIDLIRLQYQTWRFDRTIQTVVIAPTLDCNLRCEYCFVGGAQDAQRWDTMDRETEARVASYIKSLCSNKERLTISWFGGEPLIAHECIDRICGAILPFLSRRGVEVKSFLTTNGLLLTSQIVEKFDSWGIGHCQLTVDIPQDRRCYRNGKPVAWELVLEKAAMVIEKGIPVELRVNISSDSRESFDALYRLIIDTGLAEKFESISFIGITTPESGRLEAMACGSSCAVSYDVIQQQREKARACGIKVPGFVPGVAIPCGATREGYCAIDPDGNLYHCLKDLGLSERAYSSVYNGHAVNLDNLLPWLNYDWFSFDECHSCPILPQCASGCPHMRRFQTFKSNTDFCPFLRWSYDNVLANELRAFVEKM